MYFLRDASFAKNPDTQKGRFHEERHQGFNGERRAEDASDIAGIFRPVHAELEFLDDACDDTDGKVDQKELAPELGHFAPGLILGLVVTSLHVGYKPPQTQREWDEEKVIYSRQTELQSRKCDGIHRFSSPKLVCAPSAHRIHTAMLGNLACKPSASCASPSNVIAAISRIIATCTRPHLGLTGQLVRNGQSSSPLACRHSESRTGPSKASTTSLSVICAAGRGSINPPSRPGNVLISSARANCATILD